MRAHLAPCPSCARHVRVSEQACPFCGAELPAALRATPPPNMPAARLKRAAVYALGAGALAINGCGMAYPAYGGAAVPCPDGGYACYDYTPGDAGGDGDSGSPSKCCDPSCSQQMALGCNECFCMPNGEWSCTTFGCPADGSGPTSALDAATADAPVWTDANGSDSGAD
jgi:hypothetical protein